MMNTFERRRRNAVNYSNGHLLPVLWWSKLKQDDQPVYFLHAVRCAYCGREYRQRIRNAHEHLRQVHDICWWESIEHNDARIRAKRERQEVA